MSDDKSTPAADETVRQEPARPTSLDAALDTFSFTDGITDGAIEERQLDHRYAKQRELGRGGDGVVVAAIDRKMQRPVAVKSTHAKHTSRADQLRFLREARVTGQLNHPNVMPVYDIGTDPNGSLFFTMKEVTGQSLAQRLTGGQAGSMIERLLVFRQVCNAIDFAHSRGVLHRDIKPANIMMGEFGEVLVVDWGLCKVLGETPEDFENLTLKVSRDELETRQGQVAGTPAYMAPEQAQGQIDALDNRTDIYALGALLYTLITEKPPFKGPVHHVLEQVSQGDFPSARSIAPKTVPRELDLIVQRAMSLEPADRYQRVADLSDDIQAFIEERPVNSVDYSWIQRTSKWASRNKRVVRPVATTLMLALLALGVGGLVHLNQLATSRDAAVVEAERANRAEHEALREVVNGRASLATSEAMYGHAGPSMRQLRAVRQDMEVLGVDTLRADIGLAIARRTAIQPIAFEASDRLPDDISISDDGTTTAVLHEDALFLFANNQPEDPTRIPLTPDVVRTLGPWSEGSPWLLQPSTGGILGLHPITGKERSWTEGFGTCEAPQITLDGDWIAQTCAGLGMALWHWNELSEPKRYALSDAATEVIQISEDGERLYVDRFIESDAPHHRQFTVFEGGAPIWHGERGTLNSLSPDGEWIVASNTTGFSVIHIDSASTQPIDAGMTRAIMWWTDSSGFAALDTTGDLTHYAFQRKMVEAVRTDRLAVFGDTMRTAIADRSQRNILMPSESGAELFRLADPDKAIANFGLYSDETSVVSTDISADGQLMAVSTEAGRIVILDAITGWTLAELSTGTEPVRGTSFHPDGSRLLTAHWDGIARIWDLRTGTVERSFSAVKSAGSGRPAKVTDVLYIDDERVLITGGDGHIGIWSTSSGELLMDFSGEVPYAWDSAFSASTGRLIISNRLGMDTGHRAVILDLKRGEVVAKISGQTEAYGVTVSPDGAHFILTSNDQNATVLNTDGVVVRELPVATPPGYAAGWSPDGKVVAVADFSGRYQLWDTDKWELVANFGHKGMPASLLFSPSGRTLNVITNFGGVYALDLNGPTGPPGDAPAWLVDARRHILALDPAASLRAVNSGARDSVLFALWSTAVERAVKTQAD